MKKLISANFLVTLLLSACGMQEIEVTVPFDKDAAAYIFEQGSATVSGQAFLKRRDGMVVTCAGEVTSLMPVTEYAKQRIAGIYGSVNGGYRSAAGPTVNDATSQEYLKAVRETNCDAEGDFEFKNVANGEYYITSAVLWRVNDYYYDGGVLAKRITVKNGRSQNVVMSHR